MTNGRQHHTPRVHDTQPALRTAAKTGPPPLDHLDTPSKHDVGRGSSRQQGLVSSSRYGLFFSLSLFWYWHLYTFRYYTRSATKWRIPHSHTPHNVPLQVDAQPQHDDNPSRRHDKLSMWHVNTIMMTVNTTRFGCMTWLVNDGTLPVHRGAAAWENQCMFFFLHIILIY
jgi:hypothetical protein